MGIRTIYFRDDIEDRLKKEENKSGLINSLLETHYKTNMMTEEEVIAHVKEIWQKKEEDGKIKESRREMIIKKYKEHHDGIDPTEEQIQDDINLIEKINKKCRN